MADIDNATCYLIANFGGPRSPEEVPPFLQALLTDTDVVRSGLPNAIHHALFKRVASWRSRRVAKDYCLIGGRSPIYGDTETVAQRLCLRLEAPVLAFHRYLRATHRSFTEAVTELRCDEIRVFPMFPQFTWATSGSIARWFHENLPADVVGKMRWVSAYPTHPAFVLCHQAIIGEFLREHRLQEKDTVLLFSAHGLPRSFIRAGDPYEEQCHRSFEAIASAFPGILSRLCYQSKLGPGKWLQPDTGKQCTTVRSWHQGRKNVVFVPLTFTSDHLETLFEIERQYMPVIRQQGLDAFRVPTLSGRDGWIDAIVTILSDSVRCSNEALIRPD